MERVILVAAPGAAEGPGTSLSTSLSGQQMAPMGDRTGAGPGSTRGWARMRGPGAGLRHLPGDAMKKKMKKLMLAKETLRTLGERQVQQVAGATGGGIPGSGCLYCNTVYICDPPTRELDC